jgi:hypothetical protein
MRHLLTILFGLIITSGKCCDCHASLYQPFQKGDYDKIDLIYLIEIAQEIDSGVFEVRLIENFKGEFRTATKILNSKDDDCSFFVKTGEKWLVYENKGASNMTTIYACSRSRDIQKTKYWVPPPPPRQRTNREKKEYKIAYEKYLNSDRGDIEDELNQLRKMKANTH